MTDSIDTARREGIALGLAMAGSAFGEWCSEATTEAIKARILTLAAIPPHVAAARVLLDDFGRVGDQRRTGTHQVAWGAVWQAMSSDHKECGWTDWPSIFLAALEQIAGGGND